MNFQSLDIETAPTESYSQEYALQPWRVLEASAEITAIAVTSDEGVEVCTTGFGELLDELEGPIVTWNGVFDVAFLIASGYDVRHIRWIDGMLLWKWVSNSQRMEWRPKWSLADGAKRWLKDWPYMERFIKMKMDAPEAGEDDQYWELRCRLDALVTKMIAERVWKQLTPQQRRSALIEAQCIWPTANSWVQGVKLELDLIKELHPAVTTEMRDIEIKLGVQNTELKKKMKTEVLNGQEWQPSAILRSPPQKGVLLYETWGLECKAFTDKGARSTDKAALTYLADHDDRALDLLRWSELNTQYTKFINSPSEAAEYLGSNTVHPAPKIFSTYTGRYTYRSKTKQKFKTGIALHQMPRSKEIRRMVIV